MRFRDAVHVDLGSFYARRPGLGRMYRLAGWAACAWVLWNAHDTRYVGAILVLLLVAWVMAWYRCVGALFRAPLVGAILMCALLITAGRVGIQVPWLPRAPAAPAPAERTIELRMHGDGGADVREVTP
jgi:hypothetical protein